MITICRKCGERIRDEHADGKHRVILREEYKKEEKALPFVYDENYPYLDNNAVYFCPKCKEPIHCDEMTLEMFWNWLSFSQQCGDTRELLGQAVDHYFHPHGENKKLDVVITNILPL